MFFYLSKILSFLCMPFSLIVGVLLLGLLIKNPVWKRKLHITGIILLLFFSNSFIVDEVVRWWEIDPVRIESLNKTYAVAIVLGGFTHTAVKPEDRVYTNQSVDRILHTLQLYREGKVQKFLITGGSGLVFAEGLSESEQAKQLLLLSKVPEKDIILEPNARNTHENALYSAEIIRDRFPGQSCLLVTSAYHMRRAKACFDKVGLPVDVFSADLSTFERAFTPDVLFLPSPGAIEKWHLFIREILGILAYKVAGYV
jgi:uncharacterized SAM-binding protein YcdF (DUF218 family)